MGEVVINPSITDALEAYRFLRGRVRHTPFEYSPFLSDITDGNVFMKLENQQKSGAFKIRGALFKMYGMSQAERAKGVITCSSGNHGQGVALAASEIGIDAVVCVPDACPKTKQEAIRRFGGKWVELRIIDGNYDFAEEEAHRMAEEEGRTYFSSFEDHHIMCGASTIGVEMAMDEPSLDVAIIPAGGGGLMNGISVALTALCPGIHIWGVQTEASNPYVVSWESGIVKSVTYKETLADGLSGYIPQSLLSLAKTRMRGVVEVLESEMAKAIWFMHAKHRQVVEGSGAVGVAALMTGKIDVKGKNVGVVISGGNIDNDKLMKVLKEYE